MNCLHVILLIGRVKVLGRIRAGLASGVWILLLFVPLFGVVLKVPVVKGNSGTIYIRADGSIDPPTAPIFTTDNVTYTLTDNINSDADGIVVERSNIVVDGADFRLQGAGAGIGFTLNANNVTIRNTVIAGFDVAGSYFAAAIYSLNSFNNIITNNTITGNKWGVDLEWVSGYVISGNSIAGQSESGIYMRESRNNVIYENDINGNKNGIALVDSSNNNKFYQNNFVNNVSPGFAVSSESNVWDDDYPSGGNYWSDYSGVDLYHGSYQNITGSDGIGDTSYSSSLGEDRYPLMSVIRAFKAGTWNDAAYYVDVISNSTTSDFNFNRAEKSISFNVSGSSATAGFCRVAIPEALLGGPYEVWIDITPIAPFVASNGTFSFLYFTYSHSIQKVTIVGTTVIKGFPRAIFSYSPTQPFVGETVIFNASTSYDSDGFIESYSWDFGDGNVTSDVEPIIIHAYVAPGTFPVDLTVTDNDGLSNSTMKSIEIVKINSTMTVNAIPDTVPVGSNVSIIGNITPIRTGANVTISFRPTDGNWATLTAVQTNAGGNFTYSWQTTNIGAFEIKASWLGDSITMAAESEIKTVGVVAYVVYIRPDGSVEPSTAPIERNGDLYTFSGDLLAPIVAEKDNIKIDGAGYSAQGFGTGTGITLSYRNNVTLGNVELMGFEYGIFLYCSNNSKFSANTLIYNGVGICLNSSSGNLVSGNNITENYAWGAHLSGFSCENTISENIVERNSGGILLESDTYNNTLSRNYIDGNATMYYMGGPSGISFNGLSNIVSLNNITECGWGLTGSPLNCVISGNNITFSYYGMELSSSSNNTLMNNSMIGNLYNFLLEGTMLSHYVQNVDTSNMVDGKPMYYLINKNTLTINSSSCPNVGYLALVNSTNITVEGLQIENHGQSLLIAYSANLEIKNSNVSKVELYESDNNTIRENTFESQSGGVYLLNCSNNGIFRNHLLNNYGGYGIYLEHSSNNTVNSNIMEMNTYGIFLLESSSNNISRNNIVQNSRCDDGICCLTSSYNLFYYNNVSSGYYGIAFAGGSSNILVGNIVSNNRDAGIFLRTSRNNILMRNNVTGNSGVGISISWGSDNNTLIENIASNNWCGILLNIACYNNTLFDNVAQRNYYGIYFVESVNNTVVFSNTISNNIIGIGIYTDELGGCNKIFHNNFINNTVQASIPNSGYENIWDDGYPSGGNYWSDYGGVDSNRDGIGDLNCTIDVYNVDRYPLMGMFSSFNASSGYSVDVVSNSTVEDFAYFESNSTVTLHVSNMTVSQTNGFCRLTIPHGLLSPSYTITVNGTQVSYTPIFENETLSIIYFSYEHSKLEIIIIPELAPLIILPLFMIATLIAVIICNKKRIDIA